jgi:predicted lipid-binding transport protein (Tim44 family)
MRKMFYRKKSLRTWGSVLFVGCLLGWISIADARVGGGGSFGNRGSRSFSAPARPSSPAPGGVFGGRDNLSSPYARPSAPRTEEPFSRANPYAQSSPFGGSFLRGLAGGFVGGLVGSLLFRSLGFASYGPYTGGWGGPGLFDLLLLALLGYVAYRWISRRSRAAYESNSGVSWSPRSYQPEWSAERSLPQEPELSHPRIQEKELDRGIDQLRLLDPNFAPQQFCDQAMDFFFKLQAAWPLRDLHSLRSSLTDEVAAKLQSDIERLQREHLINRVENIAVRTCEITEAWQESGQDFVTVYFYANCLDYDVDETTGAVVRGSKTEPSKFEEFWTFTRPAGAGAWKLSAITQA